MYPPMRRPQLLAAVLVAVSLTAPTCVLAARPQPDSVYSGTVRGQVVSLAVNSAVGRASGSVRCDGAVTRFRALLARNGGFSTPSGRDGISLYGRFRNHDVAIATFSDPACPAPGGKLKLRLAG